jgi:hypothetical protein
MAKTIGKKIKEAAMTGGISLVLGAMVVYIISAGKYPNKETVKYFFPSAIITGALLYTIFEVTGMHENFCNNSTET